MPVLLEAAEDRIVLARVKEGKPSPVAGQPAPLLLCVACKGPDRVPWGYSSAAINYESICRSYEPFLLRFSSFSR